MGPNQSPGWKLLQGWVWIKLWMRTCVLISRPITMPLFLWQGYQTFCNLPSPHLSPPNTSTLPKVTHQDVASGTVYSAFTSVLASKTQRHPSCWCVHFLLPALLGDSSPVLRNSMLSLTLVTLRMSPVWWHPFIFMVCIWWRRNHPTFAICPCHLILGCDQCKHDLSGLLITADRAAVPRIWDLFVLSKLI